MTAPVRSVLAAPLAWAGLSPDRVTLAALPLAGGAAVAVLLHAPGIAFVLALLAVLMDLVDGEVARRTGQASPFGSCLDAVVDRAVEGILLAALAPACPLAACSALLGCQLVSYVKARVGLVIVTDNRDWPGIGDRSDRVVLILLGILLSSGSWRFVGLSATEMVLWALAGTCAVATRQRLAHARALVSEAEREGTLLPYLSAGVPPGTSASDALPGRQTP